MNAIELLSEQHREVEQGFYDVDASSGDERLEHFIALARLLTIHAHLEEELFYPAVRDAELNRYVHESLEEHAEVKSLIARLAKLPLDSTEFDANFVLLRAAVDAHVAEERAELFPDAEQKLGREGLEVLGNQMEERRQELIQPAALQTFSQRSDIDSLAR